MSNFYDQSLKLNGERKAAMREELRTKVRRLREEGLTYGLIGQRLGCSEEYARVLNSDRKWMEPRKPREPKETAP